MAKWIHQDRYILKKWRWDLRTIVEMFRRSWSVASEQFVFEQRIWSWSRFQYCSLSRYYSTEAVLGCIGSYCSMSIKHDQLLYTSWGLSLAWEYETKHDSSQEPLSTLPLVNAQELELSRDGWVHIHPNASAAEPSEATYFTHWVYKISIRTNLRWSWTIHLLLLMVSGCNCTTDVAILQSAGFIVERDL